MRLRRFRPSPHWARAGFRNLHEHRHCLLAEARTYLFEIYPHIRAARASLTMTVSTPAAWIRATKSAQQRQLLRLGDVCDRSIRLNGSSATLAGHRRLSS